MEIKIEKNQNYLAFCIIYMLIALMCFVYFAMSKVLINAILVVICTVLCIYYFLKYINEKIIISDMEIRYNNLIGMTREYSFDELSVRKVKKKFQTNTSSKSMYFRRYVLKDEYTFFNDGQKIFKIIEDEFKGNSKEIIDSAINKNRLKKERKNIDGEEVFEIKINPISLIANLFAFLFFGLLVTIIGIGLFSDFEKAIFVFFCIFVGVDLYYLFCTMKELIQVIQRVYLLENQGFYKIIFGRKEYYSFNDIEKCITKKYFCIEPVEYKLNLYKESKKVLTLTNSNSGFYDFLEEVNYKSK